MIRSIKTGASHLLFGELGVLVFMAASACGLSVVGSDVAPADAEAGTDAGSAEAAAPPVLGPARCGDGVVDVGEACDVGANDGSYGGCNPDCSKAPFCGDGVVNDSETCDLGANNSALGTCSSTCANTSLLLWLDASDLGGAVLPPDNTAVDGWTDKARGRAVVQTTASRQPKWRSAGINGKPSFQFDGVDDVFDVDLDINGAVLPQLTVVTVFQNFAGATATYTGLWGHDNGNWDRFIGTGGTLGQNGISNGVGFTPVAGLTASNVPLVVTATLRSNTPNLSTVHVNGQLAATFTGSIQPGTTHLSIGNINGPPATASTHAFDGWIAAMRIYGEALADPDRAALEAELQKTYVP